MDRDYNHTFWLFLFPIMLLPFNLDAQVIDLSNNAFNSFYSEIGDEIWISSPDGWHEFLGEQRNDFLFTDTLCGIRGDIIQSKIYVDGNKGLWFSNYSNICYKEILSDCFECFQLINKGKKLIEGYHLFFINNKNELFLRIGNELFIYNHSNNELNTISEETTRGVSFAFNDKNQNFYASPWINEVGIEKWKQIDKNIFKLEKIDFNECYENLSKILVSQIFQHNDNLWLISNEGIVLLDDNIPCNSKVYNFNSEPVVFNFGVVKDNYLIVTSEGQGIFLFDLKLKSFVNRWKTSIGRVNMLNSYPTEIFKDSKGFVYISFRGSGVLRIHSSAFLNSILLPQQLVGNLNKIHLFNDRYFLVGETKLIVSIDSNFSSDFQIEHQGLNYTNKITDSGFQKNGDLIIADYSNVFEYHYKSRKFRKKFQFEDKQIIDIYTNDNSLHLTASNKLFSFDGEAISENTDLNNKYANSIHHVIHLDDELEIFVFGSSELSYRSPFIDTILKVPSFINSYIYDRKSNNLFLGTNRGLYVIPKTLNIEKIDLEKGFHDDYIIKELDVVDSTLYILSSNGLIGLNVFDYNFKGIESLNGSESYLSYNLISSKSKQLLYNNEQLFSFSKKNSLNINSEIVLKKIIFGTEDKNSFPASNHLGNLNHDYETIELNIGLSSWKDSKFEKIMLQLYKSNDLIQTITYDPFTNYILNELEPAKYKLIISGMNSKGEVIKPEYLTFDILPPFWQTNWFRSLVVFGLISIGFFINHTRTKRILLEKQLELDRQKALQEQRNRMARNLHDEMGSGLTSIKYLSADGGKDKTKQIGTLASNLIKSMRDLLWSLDENNDNIKNLVARSKYVVNHMVPESELTVTWNIDYSDPEFVISGMKRRNLILILKEAVTNCLKHSGADNLNISIKQNGENLELIIKDNGEGFDVRHIDNSGKYGLKSIQQRAEEIDGTLNINSSTKGTSLEISVHI